MLFDDPTRICFTVKLKRNGLESLELVAPRQYKDEAAGGKAGVATPQIPISLVLAKGVI